MNQTNIFSYEIWYKITGSAGGFYCPLWWRDEPVTGDTEGWVHYVTSGNCMQTSDVIDTWHGMCAGGEWASGVWQHLLCTFDGLTKKIYVNGVLIAVSTDSHNWIRQVTRAVDTISSASYPFLGILKEAAIYTNVLSAARVDAHYTAATLVAPPAVAATFQVDFAGTTNYEGATVKAQVIALGTPPFTYQWYDGTTPLPTQTNDTLTLSPAHVSDSGNYYVVVNNVGGPASSSTNAVLIVQAPPSIVMDLVPALRLQGGSVTFTVGAGGSQPLTYLWKSNNVVIPAPNLDTLTLNDLQPSFAANYSVTVTNVVGQASSSAVSLTVIPVTPGSLAAAVVADQPVAYWRLDDTNTTTWVAADYAGGYDGVYDPSTLLMQPSGILGSTDFSATFPYGASMIVPWSLNLNTYPAQSVELWANVDQSFAGTYRPIFSSRYNNSGWHFGYELAATDADQWSFATGQRTSGLDTITGGTTTNAGWYHIVGTIDDSAGTKALYVNGKLVAQDTPATGTYGINQYQAPWVAVDEYVAQESATNGYGAGNYVGGLDEIALYNYALTPAQVAQHYAAGALPTMTITPPVGGKVTITWSGLLLQATNIHGPWTTNTTAVSPLTVTPSGTREFYRSLVQ